MFWDSVKSEAWLYSNPNPRYAIGASLLYRRRAWMGRPFKHVNTAEDLEWLMKVKCQGDTAVGNDGLRMICEIHGNNTCSKVIPTAREWTRESDWDEDCRRVMTL
jgi:hypothetical protein